MLGIGFIAPNNNKSQRQRISLENSNIELTKEEKRKIFFRTLINKYFNKISNFIIKEIGNNKKSAIFYFNYYDFLNNKLGHPQLIMQQILYEMCYEYSEFIGKDQHDNPITLKTLFGENFKFTVKGKNSVLFQW